VLWVVGNFLASIALTAVGAVKSTFGFTFGVLVSMLFGIPGYVVATLRLLDGFFVVATIARFAMDLFAQNPISLLGLLKPMQQIMFAANGYPTLFFLALIGSGGITAPLMLHTFPLVQDGLDDVWCRIWSFSDIINNILDIFAENFYNLVAPVFDYLSSWVFEQAWDIITQLATIVPGAIMIIIRIAFDLPSVLVPFSHGGTCINYPNSNLYPSSLEQLRCLALDLLQFVVNGIFVRLINAVPFIGPQISPTAHDLIWLYVDFIITLTVFIPSIAQGLVGSTFVPNCVTPTVDVGDCWVCSFGAPAGPPCCTPQNLECLFVRLFGFGQAILDIIFTFLESIPGIGDIIKLVVQLATILKNAFNTYIVDPLNDLLVPIIGVIVDGINLFLQLICTIMRAIDSFCSCVPGLGSGPTCGWGLNKPTQIIPRITTILGLPDIGGLPPGLGGRRLLYTTTTTERSQPVPPYNSTAGDASWRDTLDWSSLMQTIGTAFTDFAGIVNATINTPLDVSQAYHDTHTKVVEYVQARKDERKPKPCTSHRTAVPIGMDHLFHDSHVALDADGCPHWAPVLYTEVQHPDYPGTSPHGPPVRKSPMEDADNEPTSLHMAPAQRRFLQSITPPAAVGAIGNIVRELVFRGGVFAGIGLRMMIRWTIVTLAPLLGLIPPPSTITVAVNTTITTTGTGAATISNPKADFDALVADIAATNHIPNRKQLGVNNGGSKFGLFDPRRWVGFLTTNVLFTITGDFNNVANIADVTPAQLDAQMRAFDQWADDLILNNLPTLDEFRRLIQLIFQDLLDLRLDALNGILARIYKQFECNSAGTFDQRLRPFGKYNWGCLLHGQIPPKIITPIILLPEHIDWGVPCLTGPLGCNSYGGTRITTVSGRCIACKCPNAGYALCDTVFPSWLHLVSGLVSAAAEWVVALSQGVAAVVSAGLDSPTPNGLNYGVPQFINQTVDIHFPIPFLQTIDKQDIHIVDLYPLLKPGLLIGIDSSGASIARAAAIGPIISSGIGTTSPSSTTQPLIGVNLGVACLLVRAPTLFWGIPILVAWFAAYAGSFGIILEVALFSTYLLYQTIGLLFGLAWVWITTMGRVTMEHRIATLETSIGTLAASKAAAPAVPASLAANGTSAHTLVSTSWEVESPHAAPAQLTTTSSTTATKRRTALNTPTRDRD
jgi:hypothetical protein